MAARRTPAPRLRRCRRTTMPASPRGACWRSIWRRSSARRPRRAGATSRRCTSCAWRRGGCAPRCSSSRPCCRPRPSASVAGGLAWLGRGIGGVRDLDVLALARRGARPATGRRGARRARPARARRSSSGAPWRWPSSAACSTRARCRRLLARLGAARGCRGPACAVAVRLGDVAATSSGRCCRAVQRAGRDLDARDAGGGAPSRCACA